MFRTTWAIAKKEFRHLFRDKRFLAILIFFPVFLLAFFGYAVDFDVKNVKIAVLDLDRSQSSRKLVNELTATEYFADPIYINNPAEIRKLLDMKTVNAVVTIPEDLDKMITRGDKVTVQYLVDGVDANTAIIVANYIEAGIAAFNGKFRNEVLSKNGLKIQPPIAISPKIMYNPELKSSLFFIPGLISMILIITSVISVSLSIVRENERNTIEQIWVSPVSYFSLLLGKIFPYLVIAYLNAAMILVVGYFLFGVHVHGSYFDLFYSIFVFLLASTSLGYFVSVISPNTQVAFTLGAFVSLLPSLILSGFVFQIESMPAVIQVMTNITPTKFFNIIMRAIILRGTGIETFWMQIVNLLIFTAVVVLLSIVVSKAKERKA